MCGDLSGIIGGEFDANFHSIVAIGGCGNLKYWVTQKTAEQLGIPWAIFLDSDLGTNERLKNLAAIRA